MERAARRAATASRWRRARTATSSSEPRAAASSARRTTERHGRPSIAGSRPRMFSALAINADRGHLRRNVGGGVFRSTGQRRDLGSGQQRPGIPVRHLPGHQLRRAHLRRHVRGRRRLPLHGQRRELDAGRRRLDEHLRDRPDDQRRRRHLRRTWGGGVFRSSTTATPGPRSTTGMTEPFVYSLAINSERPHLRGHRFRQWRLPLDRQRSNLGAGQRRPGDRERRQCSQRPSSGNALRRHLRGRGLPIDRQRRALVRRSTTGLTAEFVALVHDR